MNRIATALVVTLATAGGAFAQDIVTRSVPADMFLSPADLALAPAETVTVTLGTAVGASAGDILTPRDRALAGLDRQATVGVTVFTGDSDAAPILR